MEIHEKSIINKIMAVLLGGVKSYRDCLKHEFHKLKSKKAMPQKQKVAVALNVCSPKL